MTQIQSQEAEPAYVAMPLKLAVAVRALRNAFAMSQTDLAHLAECSRPTINRIESVDRASPRTDTVERLLQVFRDRGVEIQIKDTEVLIRWTPAALQAAVQGNQKQENA
jgi:DNA-binding XRE family transcriptional regulator